MATLNSWLSDKCEEINNSETTVSKYYFFNNKSIVVRLSDHISNKYIGSDNVIQIIQPSNKVKDKSDKLLYSIFYKGHLQLLNFSEICSFIDTFLFINNVNNFNSKRAEKLGQISKMLQNKTKKLDAQNYFRPLNDKIDYLYYMSYFTPKQKCKLLKYIKDLLKKYPDEIQIKNLDNFEALSLNFIKIVFEIPEINIYIEQVKMKISKNIQK